MFLKICGITRAERRGARGRRAGRDGARLRLLAARARATSTPERGRGDRRARAGRACRRSACSSTSRRRRSSRRSPRRPASRSCSCTATSPPSYAAALTRPVLRALGVDGALDDAWPLDDDAAARRGRSGAAGRHRHGGGLDAGRGGGARSGAIVLAGGLTPDNVGGGDCRGAPVRRGRVVGRRSGAGREGSRRR